MVRGRVKVEGGGEGIRGMVAERWGMGEPCGKQVENREYEVGIDEEVNWERRERSECGCIDGKF